MSPEEFAKLSGEQPMAPASSGKIISEQEFNIQFGGESDLPTYANGISPNTPINESPVSLDDRFKLGAGNTAGRVKYLRENYGEVQRAKDGDLVVKSNGFWHRVDPNTLDISNPWKLTREIVGDISQAGTKIAATAAQVGLAAATGGASIPAQLAATTVAGAATKGVEGLLGRAFGTYQDTDEGLLRDMAIEGMLNLGGGAIALGMKPAGKFLSDKMGDAVEMIKKAPAASREIFEEGYGSAIGKNGPRSVNFIIEKPEIVKPLIKELADSPVPADEYRKRAVGLIKGAAERVDEAASNFFEAGKTELKTLLPNGFKSQQDAVYKDMLGFFGEKGLAANGKALTQKEVVDQLAAKGISSEWAANPEAFKVVDKVWRSLQDYAKIGSTPGAQGADNLMQMRRSLMSLVNSELETLPSNSIARPFLGQFSQRLEQAIIPKFNLEKPVMAKVVFGDKPALTNNMLESLNASYSQIKNTLKPLSNTMKSASSLGDLAYENAIDSITAQAGRKLAQKSSFDASMELLSKYGSSSGKLAAGNYERLMALDAAKDFVPWIKPGLASKLGGLGSIGAGVFNPAAGAAMLGATALTATPRIGAAIITGTGASKQALQAFFESNKMVRSLTPAARFAFVQTPEAVAKVFQTAYSAPGVKEGIQRQLSTEGLRKIRGEGNR
jgi:hypothetical protein